VKIEDYAFYKAQAEKLGISLSQYMADILSAAHSEMLDETTKVKESKTPYVSNAIADETEENDAKNTANLLSNKKLNAINMAKTIPLTIKEIKDLVHAENLKFIDDNHIESILEAHAIELEQVKQNTKAEILKEVNEKNILIPVPIPEFITLWNKSVEYRISKGNIKHAFNLIQIFFRRQHSADRE